MREAPNIPPQTPSRRGGRVTDRIMTQDPRQRQAPEPFLTRVIAPYIDRMMQPGTNMHKMVNPDEIRIRLLRANFPFGLRASTFVAIKFVAIALGAAYFALFFPFLRMVAETYGVYLSWFYLPFFAIIGALYGFRMPDIWLGIKIKKRQTDIQLVLPDMIDLISISVEAGLGLVAAIQRISERFDNPLSEEFLRTLQEVRLGRPQADAFRDMARRVDVGDLSSLLTAIVQAELLGLAVSNVLRVQSERLRERRSQRAREMAQKAPIKMTFPLVLFIFPALFVVILGPAMIKIFLEQNTF